MSLPFPLNHFGTDPADAVVAAVNAFRGRFVRAIRDVQARKKLAGINLQPGVRLDLNNWNSRDALQVAARWVALLKRYPSDMADATFKAMSSQGADDDARAFEPITMTAIAAVVIPLLPVIIPAIAGMVTAAVGVAGNMQAESEETKRARLAAERKAKEEKEKRARNLKIAIAAAGVVAVGVGVYFYSKRK